MRLSRKVTMKLDPRGSSVLGMDECRRHLERAAAASGIGRLALNTSRSPYVIPVNFTVIGGGVVVRLGPGWAAFHLNGVPVTFETDQVAESRPLGLERRRRRNRSGSPLRRGRTARCQAPDPNGHGAGGPGVRDHAIQGDGSRGRT